VAQPVSPIDKAVEQLAQPAKGPTISETLSGIFGVPASPAAPQGTLGTGITGFDPGSGLYFGGYINPATSMPAPGVTATVADAMKSLYAIPA